MLVIKIEMSEAPVEVQTFSVEEHLDILKRLPLNREGTEVMNALWNGTLRDDPIPSPEEKPLERETPEEEPAEQKN